MKRWKLIEPDVELSTATSLEQIIENGSVFADYSLPAVKCPRCSTRGYLRLFRHELPDYEAEHFNLTDAASLSPDSFVLLQRELSQALLLNGVSISPCELTPGLVFPPLVLDIPEPPKYDILFGGAFPLISQKAKRVLSQFDDGSVFFCRAKYGQVGKWFPKEISERDAEGIIDVDDALEYVTEFYPSDTPLNYYGLGVTARTYPSDFIPNEVCEECGRFAWKREPQIQNPHIFYIGDTLWIGVSNQLKEALEDEGITNLSFSAIVD